MPDGLSNRQLFLSLYGHSISQVGMKKQFHMSIKDRVVALSTYIFWMISITHMRLAYFYPLVSTHATRAITRHAKLWVAVKMILPRQHYFERNRGIVTQAQWLWRKRSEIHKGPMSSASGYLWPDYYSTVSLSMACLFVFDNANKLTLRLGAWKLSFVWQCFPWIQCRALSKKRRGGQIRSEHSRLSTMVPL